MQAREVEWFTDFYKIYKEEAKTAVRKAKEEYERKITLEIKLDKNNRMLLDQINKLSEKK